MKHASNGSVYTWREGYPQAYYRGCGTGTSDEKGLLTIVFVDCAAMYRSTLNRNVRHECIQVEWLRRPELFRRSDAPLGFVNVMKSIIKYIARSIVAVGARTEHCHTHLYGLYALVWPGLSGLSVTR